MKKILTFILLIASVAVLYGQGDAGSKFKRGINVGNPSANMQDWDSAKYESGQLRIYHSDSILSVYNDSILVLLDSLTAVKTSLDADIDSLETSLAASNNRISVLEGADVLAPGVDSAYIQTGNDSVIWVQFNENLGRDDNDSVTSAFSFTYGTGGTGTAGVVDSAVVSGVNVVIYSNTSIPTTDTVYVTYTRPVSQGVHDEAGNDALSFSNKLVFNGTSATEYEALAWYRFNGDLLDYYASNNGSAVNTIAYTSDTAIIFSESDGDDAVNIGDFLTGDFTVWFWLLLDEDANENYYIFANVGDIGTESGFILFADGTGAGTFGITLSTGNGATSQSAYDNSGDFKDDTWHHVVVRVNRVGNATDAYARFWIDGVANDNDTVLTGMSESFDVAGKDVIIGAKDPGDEDSGLREGAILGEFGIDDVLWDQAKVDSSFAQRGNTLWSVGSTPTPVGYDTTITEIERVDFTDHPLTGLTNASLDTLYTGTRISTSTLGNIVSLGSDTVWQMPIPPVDGVAGGQYYMTTPGNYIDVWYSYNIYLASDFDWSVGGKIPGLGVLDRDNSTPPDGNDIPPTGGIYGPLCTTDPSNIYSAERGSSPRGGIIDGASEAAHDLGFYIYYQNMTFSACSQKTYGEDLGGGFAGQWTRGTWHNITMRFHINDVNTEGIGEANGWLEFYKDGVCGAVHSNITFRRYSNMYFDMYMHSVFLGGPTDLSRTGSSNIYHDDFVLWQFDDGHPYQLNSPNAVGTVIVPPNINDK